MDILKEVPTAVKSRDLVAVPQLLRDFDILLYCKLLYFMQKSRVNI